MNSPRTRRRAEALSATIVLAIAGWATTASAAPAAPAAESGTVRAHNIVSPTGAIRCSAQVDSKAIECMADYLPEVGDLDSFLGLRPRGRAVLGERGDFGGYTTPARTLGYGDVWKRPGIRCAMATTGLTCRNRDNHGFHLQRGNVYRF